VDSIVHSGGLVDAPFFFKSASDLNRLERLIPRAFAASFFEASGLEIVKASTSLALAVISRELAISSGRWRVIEPPPDSPA
jgi:hypothetical protein